MTHIPAQTAETAGTLATARPSNSRRRQLDVGLLGLVSLAVAGVACFGPSGARCQRSNAHFTPCANDHQIVLCQEDQETGDSADEIATCQPEAPTCVSNPTSGGSCENLHPLECIEQLVTTLADGRTGRTQVIDLDGDGFTDVAFDDQLGVHVTRSLGDRTFAPVVTVGPLSIPWKFGDYDGDTIPDFLQTSEEGHVMLAHGRGDGTFDPAQSFVPPWSTTPVTAGDFDGDGIDDYVVQTASSLQVIESHVGYGVTEEMPFLVGQALDSFKAIPLGPANRWALLVVHAGESIEVHSIGTGMFATILATLPGHLQVTGDFNGDDPTDLIVGTSIAFGNGDGTFTLDTTTPVIDGDGYLMAADFDGDGHLDLKEIASDSAKAIHLISLRGRGDGRFVQGQQAYVQPFSARDPVRIDPSGAWDLLVLTAATELRILRGNCP